MVHEGATIPVVGLDNNRRVIFQCDAVNQNNDTREGISIIVYNHHASSLAVVFFVGLGAGTPSR
jgi:hypothetical protein